MTPVLRVHVQSSLLRVGHIVRASGEILSIEKRALFRVAGGKTVDATQEMLALGACNLISSFVGSMPISGALSRGAVNNASGVKTTFGGIYTGNVFVYITVGVQSDRWLTHDRNYRAHSF